MKYYTYYRGTTPIATRPQPRRKGSYRAVVLDALTVVGVLLGCGVVYTATVLAV